jgi:hypothetical protein
MAVGRVDGRSPRVPGIGERADGPRALRRVAVAAGRLVSWSTPSKFSQARALPPGYRDRMARVLLSHASPDKPAVRRIATALRSAGHDIWLDEEQILVGESIPAAVERGLRAADFVVLCLSKAASERGWVEAERDATLVEQLYQRKQRILPVRLEPVEPPYLIAQLAYVDLFPDEAAFAGGIARLINSISSHETRRAGTTYPLEPAHGSAVQPAEEEPAALLSGTYEVRATVDRRGASRFQIKEKRMTREEDLLTRLQGLLSSQFETVLFRARVPFEHISAPSAPQATRAVEVMRYLAQQNQLEQLARILAEVAGPL